MIRALLTFESTQRSSEKTSEEKKIEMEKKMHFAT